MDINTLIRKIKERDDYHKVGMILCHNGVVRGTSRDGSPVGSVDVRADGKPSRLLWRSRRSGRELSRSSTR